MKDFVIYDPTEKLYVNVSLSDCSGWHRITYGTALEATGFNDYERAKGQITGLHSPSGRTLIEKVLELKHCEVHERTILVETRKY